MLCEKLKSLKFYTKLKYSSTKLQSYSSKV